MTITTHVLDTSKGVAASDIPVILLKSSKGGWTEVGKGETNGDGRLSFDCESVEATYQLLFNVETYLKKFEDHFYSVIPVVFSVEDVKRKYHVPLLLSPYGYSTYRGS